MNNPQATFEEREAEYPKRIARLEEENNNLKSQLKQYKDKEDGSEKTANDYVAKYGQKIISDQTSLTKWKDLF